jgi:hypothetical protein
MDYRENEKNVLNACGGEINFVEAIKEWQKLE